MFREAIVRHALIYRLVGNFDRKRLGLTPNRGQLTLKELNVQNCLWYREGETVEESCQSETGDKCIPLKNDFQETLTANHFVPFSSQGLI